MYTDDSTPADQTDQESVSPKSTKGEIFSAYKQLLKEFHEKAGDSRGKKETKQAHEQEIVQRASGYSVENILEAISNLDSTVRRSLRDLGEQLIRESQKLRELQDAIRIEQENLQKTKEIKVEVDTLENLIEAQRAEKRQFEEETVSKREDFQKEMQATKEAWKREQEEYEYERELNRKKEENEYAEKTAQREAELANRVKTIATAEQELADLRKKAAEFASELNEAVRKAKEEASSEIRKEEQTKADLLKEKYDGERRIAALTIDMLKERVAAMETEMAALKTALSSATQEVKDVAVKVIEGQSRLGETQRMSQLLAEQKGRGETKRE
ncbi:hypothetical protein HZA42_05340 [Candidatus Peregrinibacteria bacterium]|nr:hypothetical protein [Candidatus Peregrinibacteria bacterium]